MRILPLFALAILVWLVYRIWRNHRQQNARGAVRRDKREGNIEEMVRCAKCGLHVPRHEALQAGDRYYCSAAHRDSDQA